MKISKLKSWQTNPESITSSSIQLWTNGTMRTAQLENAVAKAMVASGTAFVITSQAIGSIKNGETFS